MDEREGGAALELIRVVGEGGDDAAGEAGFTGAERAGESDDIAGAECGGETGGGEVSCARGTGVKMCGESGQSRKEQEVGYRERRQGGLQRRGREQRAERGNGGDSERGSAR